MNLLRNSALTALALLLAAVIGCGNEEDASPKPSGPIAAPPGDHPNYPATSKDAPAKPDSSKEMTPPPAKEGEKTGKPEDTKKPSDPPKLEEPAKTTQSETSPTKLTADELAAIKELPAAEQAVAIKQAVCPVSSHHLGSMEKPVKVTAEGRTFYLCCGGCEEELKANPKAVIAKLDKK
jgi:YHS domain-containing protein